jgi:DNA-binding transcriptional ArsR family regulator
MLTLVTDVAALGVAALLGDPTRATMLDALMDGRARPAGELARRAGIAPSTASEHLARLVAGRLLVVEPRGRERRYRLASAEVAEVLEALSRLGSEAPASSLRAASRSEALRAARTCYDHLAGRLGVAVTEGLVAREVLLVRDGSFELTEDGEVFLVELGVDVAGARARTRVFARACLDWSERRPHLAGALGAALADAALDHGWVRRRPNDRALSVTPDGNEALRGLLGVVL